MSPCCRARGVLCHCSSLGTCQTLVRWSVLELHRRENDGSGVSLWNDTFSSG